LIESAFAGTIFTGIAWYIVKQIVVFAPEAIKVWARIAPSDIPFIGTTSLAFIIGCGFPYLLNWVLGKTGFMTVEDAQVRAVLKYGAALERLFCVAYATERMVLITLDSRKTYAGYVVNAPNLDPHDTSIAIVPCLSGYRSDEDLSVKFTVKYIDIYEEEDLDPNGFTVVLPIPQICCAAFFDEEAYSKFSPTARPMEASRSTETDSPQAGGIVQ
jgi:hypothetical protein